MSYIGNQPSQAAFLTDQFSGNASTTAFTMSVAPANTASVLVAITGVVQDPSTYSVVGTTLTFSAAPPTGTGNISVRYLGIPASGVTTTAYRTVTEFTATAGQTLFTPPSYTVGYINVYRNGVRLGSADYTATNGTTVTLTNAATSGDLVTVESFLVSSVLNALPTTGGTIGGNLNIIGNESVLGKIEVQQDSGSNNRVILRGQPSSSYRWNIDNYGSTNLMRFFREDDATAGSGVVMMAIDNAGNVGIGTSSPNSGFSLTTQTPIYVNNQATDITPAAGGWSGQVTVKGSGYSGGLSMDSTGLWVGHNSGSRAVVFATNTTERMRIDSSGNLLVGGTSSAARMYVVGAGTTSATLAIRAQDSSTADLFYVRNDGYGYLKAAAWAYGSDASLKENIEYLTPDFCLEKLSQAKPAKFDYISGAKQNLGYIANDVEEWLPEAVDLTEEGKRALKDGFINVLSTGAIQALHKTIQEQQAIIVSMREEIDVLKAKVGG